MENLKKRYQRLEKEKNINNFFKLMAIKNICLVISISVVLTKIDLSIYTIIIIICDYSISIMRFNTIYKKAINYIMIIILLINIILEVINDFAPYRIVVLIALLIIFAFISIREIRLFNKAKSC
jgi:hypothetical protein